MENFQGFIKKNLRYIIVSVLFIVLILVLVKFTTTGDKVVDQQSSTEQKKPDDGENIISAQPAKDDTKAEKEEEKVDYTEVEALVTKYYEALGSCDLETLKQIVSPFDENEQAHLKKQSEYITAYENVVSYPNIGPEDKTYVVFVSYEMKFVDLNTTAPGLSPLYICTNDEGVLYVNKEELDTEVSDYINTIAQNKEIAALITSVNTKYEEAQTSDPDLKDFVENKLPVLAAAAANAKPEDVLTDEVSGAAAETKDDEKTAAEKKKEKKKKKAEKEAKAAEEEAKAQEEQQPAEEPQTDAAAGQKVDEKIRVKESCKVREQASTDSAQVDSLYTDDYIYRTETFDNGWSKIRTPRDIVGYVKTEFLDTGSIQAQNGEAEPQAPSVVAGDTVTITQTLNVRKSMSETADRVGQAYPGESLKIIMDYAEGWSKVEWNGQTGFVKTDLIK